MPDYRKITSSDLPEGYTDVVLADQINRLWADLFLYHAHASASGDGIPINHADLTDEVIADTGVTHITINKHIQGSGTSATPDTGGGNSGVHGLPGGSYVAGISKDGLCIQVATGTTDRYNSKGQRGRAWFAVPFQEAPYCMAINTTGITAATTVYQRLITSCAVRFAFVEGSGYYHDAQHNVPFTVIAIGKVGERTQGY